MKRSILPLALLAVLSLPSLVRSDALVLTFAMNATTIAEFFVEEDGVTAELEVGVADLMGFADMLPDDVYEVLMRAAEGETEAPGDREPLPVRAARFFQRPSGGGSSGENQQLPDHERRRHLDLGVVGKVPELRSRARVVGTNVIATLGD